MSAQPIEIDHKFDIVSLIGPDDDNDYELTIIFPDYDNYYTGDDYEEAIIYLKKEEVFDFLIRAQTSLNSLAQAWLETVDSNLE